MNPDWTPPNGYGLTKKAKWAPSQKPYAFDLSTFRVPNEWSATIDAVWPGRKNGVLTVTIGAFGLSPHPLSGAETLPEMIAAADLRYGGKWRAQWNGADLLVNPSHPVSFKGKAALVTRLDAMLAAFPLVPAGFDGWYYR